MASWLLLKNEQSGLGEAIGVGEPEATSNLPESDVDGLVVAKAVFNGDSSGDAAKSLARGGGVALRLLARQYRSVWPAAPLKKLSVETLTPLSGSYDGDSGDLLYALVTFLSLARDGDLIDMPERAFAATGTLDSDGVVGPVQAVVAKVEAAIQKLPRGSVVFYPRHKPEGETRCIDEALIVRARDRGIELRAVEFIEEALATLGIEVLWWSRNQAPYRALEPYQVEHSPIFFGRDDQVTEFIARLQQAAEAKRPGGLVEAASGSGKSSFVQAGLLARLRILPRKAQTAVEYAVWQPRLAGASQVTEIDEAALARSVLLNWKTPAGVNSSGFSGLNDVQDIHTLEDLGVRLGKTVLDDRLLVWVVDQFEELFTQNFADAARVAFARFLAQMQALGVWVIGTLRTEFKSRFMALADEHGKPLLVEVFKNLMFPLARMPDEALGQMISEPARVAGVSFQTRADGVRLDALLCQDARGADSMPLVGYALNELWLKKKQPSEPDQLGRRTPQLTFEAYKAICGGKERGGIRRVLGIEAERAFEMLPQEACDELPRLLEALAVPLEGEEKETARPADLARWEDGTPGRHLIEALTEKRLLITEPATQTLPQQVRVVHEALFEGWDRAKEELAKSRDTRTHIKRLVARHDEWAKHGEPPDELLTSAAELELADAARLNLVRRSELTDVLRFVDLSLRRGAQKVRRRKQAFFGLASGVIVLSIMVGVTVRQTLTAQHESMKALASAAAAEAEARRATLAEVAASAAATSEASARKLAEEWGRDASQQRLKAEAAVVEAESSRQKAIEQRSRALAETADAALERGNPMQAMLLALEALPTANEWPWDSRAEAVLSRAWYANNERARISRQRGYVSSLQFSPDGTLLATASSDGSVWLRRTSQLAVAPNILRHREGVANMSFSPNSRQLAVQLIGGAVHLWDIGSAGYEERLLAGPKGFATDLAFDESGKFLAACILGDTPDDRSIIVWNTADGRKLLEARDSSLAILSTLRFVRGKDQLIAYHNRAKRLIRWNLYENGSPRTSIIPQNGSGTIDPSGSSLIIARPFPFELTDKNINATLVDIRSDSFAARELEGSGDVESFYFSGDGKTLVGRGKRALSVWSLEDSWIKIASYPLPSLAIESVSSSWDGSRINVLEKTGQIWQFERKSANWSALAPPQYGLSQLLQAASPDGVWVATLAPGDKLSMYSRLPPNLHKVTSDSRGTRYFSEIARDASVRLTRVYTGQRATIRLHNMDAEGDNEVLSSYGVASSAEIAQISKLGERVAILQADRRSILVLTRTSAGTSRRLLKPDLPPTAFDSTLGPATVGDIALSDSGNFLAVTSIDVTCLFDLRLTAPACERLAQGSDSAKLPRFNNSETRLVATGLIKKKILVWDLENRSSAPLETEDHRIQARFKALSISPNGRYIVTSSDDNVISRWSVEKASGKPRILRIDAGDVQAIATDREGRLIVGGSPNGQLRAWMTDGDQAYEVARVQFPNEITDLRMGDEGTVFVLTSEAIFLWKLHFGAALVAQASEAATHCLADDIRIRLALPATKRVLGGGSIKCD